MVDKKAKWRGQRGVSIPKHHLAVQVAGRRYASNIERRSKRTSRFYAATFAVSLVCLLHVRCEVGTASVNFERDVRPILITHCFACHGQWHRNGDLDVRSVELMRRGGQGGPGLSSNDMQKSRLLRRLLEGEMPPLDEPQLSEQQLETIQQWILAGAPADDPSAVYGAEFYQRWGCARWSCW